MVCFIQNVSMKDVQAGYHFDCGPNSMLIQIQDPYTVFVQPKHQFKEVHKFHFHDCNDEDEGKCEFNYIDEHRDEYELTPYKVISDHQAKDIIKLLYHALDNRMQVVVHCHAGLCRSGAVAQVAEMMGFAHGGRDQLPNRTVKTKLMRVLGWTYDSSANDEVSTYKQYF